MKLVKIESIHEKKEDRNHKASLLKYSSSIECVDTYEIKANDTTYFGVVGFSQKPIYGIKEEFKEAKHVEKDPRYKSPQKTEEYTDSEAVVLDESLNEHINQK